MQLLPGPKILPMIRVKSCLLQLEAFWSESVCCIVDALLCGQVAALANTPAALSLTCARIVHAHAHIKIHIHNQGSGGRSR